MSLHATSLEAGAGGSQGVTFAFAIFGDYERKTKKCHNDARGINAFPVLFFISVTYIR